MIRTTEAGSADRTTRTAREVGARGCRFLWGLALWVDVWRNFALFYGLQAPMDV